MSFDQIWDEVKKECGVQFTFQLPRDVFYRTCYRLYLAGHLTTLSDDARHQMKEDAKNALYQTHRS